MHQTWISTGSCSTRGPCCPSTWSLQTSCSAKDFRPWCQLTTLWKEWVQETTVNTILLVGNKIKLILSSPSPTTAWGKLLAYKELLHISPVEMNSGSLQQCQAPHLLLLIAAWISWWFFLKGKVTEPNIKPSINRRCITCMYTWIDTGAHMTTSIHFMHSLHSSSFSWNLGIGKSQQLRCHSASVCRS